ncbi:MAG: hypothetical protein HY023_03385 [Chloroflexi bacterium]|nr:hypothetical protein [Chloroflexota bacterium]MBI3763746.1 hypothetical protein [Chloroflexota bacterium]
MAKKIIRPKKAFERNARLLFNLMRYILAHPEILDRLPDNFELVILPSDDPELLQYNLALLDSHDTAGKQVVFVRMSSSEKVDFQVSQPRVYVPLAA